MISSMASRVPSSDRIVNFVRINIPLWSRTSPAYTQSRIDLSVPTVKSFEKNTKGRDWQNIIH